MATKIIKALVNGVVQNIEVEDLISPEILPSVEERVDILEDKHEVVISEGSMLVGDGTPELKEMAPVEVLRHINGASITMLSDAEYNTMEEKDANIFYLVNDGEEPEYALQSDFEALQTEVDGKSQVQVVTPESSEILPTLKIHKLTKEEYEQEVANGTIEENALYLTPEEKVDLSGYATIEQVNAKADIVHDHDSSYDAYGSANTALETANAYTDNTVAQKTQVQIITWEADD